ncbi:hypothetical protein Btru_033661 [Bulinus truncatus]|nr:hypothetical protein Btru_033661 [Bulinus truncatus]
MKRFLYFLFLYNILKLVECQACNETGFFGPSCQFKCHCKGACDNTGNCTSRSRECATGWFGLRCQYYDVTVNASVKAGTTVLENTDSCFTGVISNSLTFKWNDPVPFTWMRIRISPSKYRRNGFSTESLLVESLRHFTLKFKDNSSKTTQCRNQKVFQLNETAFDIYCNFNLPMKQLIVEGETVKSICQIKISGGRNLALKQKTYQTSTFASDKLFGPRLAVDGSVRATCAYDGCSHTNINDTNPCWAVIFDKQYDINSFNLYNRVDDSGWRLRHFNLQALDSSNTTIFNYTDTDNEDKLNYTVLYLTGSLVSGVKVSQTNINNKTNQISVETDKVPYVSINEFEAFGDCKPGTWGLNCTDQCKSPCIDQCVRDDGSCNVFCVGYSDPPTCTIECDKGIWGLNCAKRCNSSCYKSFCNKKNGTCLNGCLGFSDPPQCTEPCTIGHFGKNCTKRCHSNCFNETCHPASGQCLSCYPGYQGDNCDKNDALIPKPNTSLGGELSSLNRGVGMTGTFIALRNVMMQAEKEKKVDFYNTVLKLRQDRMMMVQTAEQYEFLHKAALAAIVCFGTTISGNEFEERLKILEKKTINENSLKGLETTEKSENIYQNSSTTLVKDRFPDIIPSDPYRPHLVCSSTGDGGYINAIVLSGFRQKNQQIITQLPMPHTLTDFWSLVTQYNVSTMVAFEVDGMKSDKTFDSYLPLSTDCIMTSSPFQIKSGHRTDEKLWHEQQLTVSIEKNSPLCVKPKDPEHHKLTHIQCKFTELDCKKMLSFITEIRKKLSADGRILYMCRNGALYSGLACVLSMLLDRMDNDSCINIPLVVGTIKSIRPQVIPTVEQYRLLYKILQLYIQKPNDYSRKKVQPNDGALSSVRSNVGGTDIYANF